MTSLSSIFWQFLRFGFLAWGGPVAQIAMIRQELVEKQHWITPEKFKRALAVYQALPGPEAHELAVYFGTVRAGRWGGFLAGLGFMLPGLVLMLLMSWAYVSFGASTLLPLFVGVAPAVAALIARAAHRISTHVLTDQFSWALGLASVGLTVFNVNFIFVFVISALSMSLWRAEKKPTAIVTLITLSVLSLIFTKFATLPTLGSSTGNSNFLIEGLKAGLLSFGGAYTAIPFLQNALVGTPNITQQTFLDSIALSSVIPAPLIIFGTFLGYVGGGLSGALLITLGIFTPAFAFTLCGHEYLERIINNKALHGALDGISAAVAGFLVLTAFQIFMSVVTTWQHAILFTACLAAFIMVKKTWITPLMIFLSGMLGWLWL